MKTRILLLVAAGASIAGAVFYYLFVYIIENVLLEFIASRSSGTISGFLVTLLLYSLLIYPIAAACIVLCNYLLVRVVKKFDAQLHARRHTITTSIVLFGLFVFVIHNNPDAPFNTFTAVATFMVIHSAIYAYFYNRDNSKSRST